MGAPIKTEVKEDNFYMLGPAGQIRIPNWPMPPLMNNHGNYIVSMANVCRWMAGVAEGLGVEIFPGMSCSELVFDGDRVKDLTGISAPVFAADGQLAGAVTLTMPTSRKKPAFVPAVRKAAGRLTGRLGGRAAAG